MKSLIPLFFMVALILMAQGCAAPRYLVKINDCPESAGDYKICEQAQVVKIK